MTADGEITSEKIIGGGLGLLLKQLLGEGSRPQIRVAGFRPGEIREALLLSGLTEAGDNPALVMVSGSPLVELEGLLPNSSYTASGHTATYGRNHNTHGFVYFQLNSETDAQSTGAMFPIRDSSFFEDDRWLHLLRTIHPRRHPEATFELEAGVRNLIRHYQSVRRLPLRKFAAFLEGMSRGWRGIEFRSSLSSDDRISLLEEALPELGLFRYSELSRSLVLGRDRAAARELRSLIYGSALTKPSGAELESGQILTRLQTVRFSDDPARDWKLKELARRYVLGDAPEALREVDFSQFATCLRPIRGLELGTAVRHFLENKKLEESLKAFESNGWATGLNERDPEVAIELMQTEAVFQRLDRGLQRRIQRILPREVSYPEPLFGLIESLDELLTDESSASTLRLELGGESPLLRGAFVFLYGPLFREMKQRLESQVEVVLDSVFTDERPWEHEKDLSAENDEEERQIDEAQSLSITLDLGPDGRRQFKWEPDKEDVALILLWIRAICSERWQELTGVWRSGADLREVESLDGLDAPEGLLPEWSRERASMLKALASSGLVTHLVETYVKRWSETLIRMLEESGELTDGLRLLLGTDCIELRASAGEVPEKVWMLGSHPLRLRWFIAWRERLGGYFSNQLTGRLRVSRWNPGYIRRHMSSWSAHLYPPALSIRPGEVHIPIEERGWCEVFVHQSSVPRMTIDVDPAAIKALVQVASDYVTTRPYKKSGLHILLTVGEESGIAREFIRQFSRKQPDTRLVLHLAAPAGAVEIDSLVEAGQARSMLRTGEHSHFPMLEVRHHTTRDSRSLPESLIGGAKDPGVLLDIAIVPFLFSGSRQFTARHDPTPIPSECADPVLERPLTRLRGKKDLVLKLRPPTRDRILFAWADATSRSFSKGRINPTSGGQDFLELHGGISREENRFRTLRQLARQVAVIDVGLSRRQFLSLSHSPEILHVATGQGKNGDYCLVLASDCTRTPLTETLMGLLKSQAPSLSSDRRRQMVSRVVEGSGHLAPDLALKAADSSAFASEFLGRHALRRYADRHHTQEGSRFWVGLDGHSDWFAGVGHPDMIRITVSQVAGATALQILVCESRVSKEGGAAQATIGQLKAGVEMFADILGPNSAQRLDRGLWTISLAKALDDAWATGAELSDRARTDIVEGKYRLRVQGLGAVWNMDHTQEPLCSFDAEDVQVFVLGSQSLAESLEDPA